jgi:hypothetical protein
VSPEFCFGPIGPCPPRKKDDRRQRTYSLTHKEIPTNNGFGWLTSALLPPFSSKPQHESLAGVVSDDEGQRSDKADPFDRSTDHLHCTTYTSRVHPRCKNASLSDCLQLTSLL